MVKDDVKNRARADKKIKARTRRGKRERKEAVEADEGGARMVDTRPA